MVKRRRDAYEGDIVMNREHVCPELKIVFHHKLFLKGKMKMKKVKQLFIVSGAMGVGKSTIAKILMARKSDTYIILKGDLCNVMAFPEVISECRKTWVDICLDISDQTSRAVVFYVDAYPDCFCGIDEEIHKRMHFVSLVCDEEELKRRIEGKYREASHQRISNIDKTWLEQSLIRNQVYSGRTKYQYPEMERIDTTDLNAEQSADLLDQWMTRILTKW